MGRFVGPMEKEAIRAVLASLFRTFITVWQASICRSVAVNRPDYIHDYALELIEQLPGSKTQAEAVKRSRIQMLK